MRMLAIAPIVSLAAVVPATAEAPSPPAETRLANASQRVAPPTSHARAVVREARERLRLAIRRAQPKPRPVAVPPHLEAIARCESGGDPRAVSANGLYRGKYQFAVSTWQSVGGTGDPAAAPEAEQDRRALMLYERSGPGQWPVCGG
jgi:hypothetical protein